MIKVECLTAECYREHPGYVDAGHSDQDISNFFSWQLMIVMKILKIVVRFAQQEPVINFLTSGETDL